MIYHIHKYRFESKKLVDIQFTMIDQFIATYSNYYVCEVCGKRKTEQTKETSFSLKELMKDNN